MVPSGCGGILLASHDPNAAIPNEVENIIDTIASKIETESTSAEVDNRALAAKETKELEQKERRAKQKAEEKLKADSSN